MNDKQKNKPGKRGNSPENSSGIDPVFNNRPELEQFVPRKYLIQPFESRPEISDTPTNTTNEDQSSDNEPVALNAVATENTRTFDPEEIMEIISTTTRIIHKLVATNENTKTNALEIIYSLEEQLVKEKNYSQRLQKEMDDIKLLYQEEINQNQTKILELERVAEKLSNKLKQSMDQLQHSVKWLENLNNKFSSELVEVLAQAEKSLKKL